uniref:Bicarbonate transporter-like transmembrane domain-containing protein n=1 Tax=Lygus hesperus TaxID=30085 RepID=A0A0K8T4U5_LYGHE
MALLIGAEGRKELLSAINEFLDSSIVLPPGNWDRNSLLPFEDLKAKSDAIRRRQSRVALPKITADQKALLDSDGDGDGWKKKDDPLRRTKIPFGGLYNDIKRRFPHYLSDFRDGIDGQCLAAAIFMYFAALSGAITFGGLMADKTNNLVGISETLIATSLSGIAFALLSGQPLVIVGATGPLLLFDESLYTFCLTADIDYLTMRVFIGIWLLIIALMVSFFEGSVLVKLFTRFTEEIFASLISLLYIVESVMKICKIYYKHPMMSLMSYAHEYCLAVNDTMPCSFTTVLSLVENSTVSPLLNTTARNFTTGLETALLEKANQNSNSSGHSNSTGMSTYFEPPVQNEPEHGSVLHDTCPWDFLHCLLPQAIQEQQIPWSQC